MIEIIGPERFRELPWKNGKGITTQLAISVGGSLADFDWRISIAQVVEDGPFSRFEGVWRNLALLAGQGIWLSHDEGPAEPLMDALAVASFDGAAATQAKLAAGPIVDFNLMSRTERYRAEMQTLPTSGCLSLEGCEHAFVYAHGGALSVEVRAGSLQLLLPAGHLLQLTGSAASELTASGQGIILMGLRPV